MSKICTNCGREASDESLFCPSCGARFAQQEPIQQHTPVQQEEPVKEFSMNQSPYEPQQYEPKYQQPYEQQYQQPYQPQYQPQYQQQYSPAPQPQKVKVPGRGFGIASMVLGIIAVLNAFSLLMVDLSTGTITVLDDNYTQGAAAFGLKFILTFMIVFVGILTLLSVIFGIVSVVKGYKKTSIAGLVMGGISLIICIVSIFVVSNLKAPTINELIQSNGFRSDNDGSYSFDIDDLDDFEDFYNYFN